MFRMDKFIPSQETLPKKLLAVCTVVLSFVLFFSTFLPSSALALPENKYGVSCRIFRSKKAQVPVFAEADRRSEVVGRLSRSEEVCGMSETKDFVTVLWNRDEAADAPPKKDVPRAFVRLVDVWHPKNEVAAQTNQAKEWWKMRQNGVVPDDPLFWLRPFLSFFGISKQDVPIPQAAPAKTPTPVDEEAEQ